MEPSHSFGRPFPASPLPKFLFSPQKRIGKAFNKVMKIDPSREILDDSPRKCYITKIYSGEIEALNPMPASLQDLINASASLDKFTQQICEMNFAAITPLKV